MIYYCFATWLERGTLASSRSRSAILHKRWNFLSLPATATWTVQIVAGIWKAKCFMPLENMHFGKLWRSMLGLLFGMKFVQQSTLVYIGHGAYRLVFSSRQSHTVVFYPGKNKQTVAASQSDRAYKIYASWYMSALREEDKKKLCTLYIMQTNKKKLLKWKFVL